MKILKEYQQKAVDEMLAQTEKVAEDTFVMASLDSAMATGKTTMVTNLINTLFERKSNAAVIWCSTGAADLHLQSKTAIDEESDGGIPTELAENLRHTVDPNTVVFVDWQKFGEGKNLEKSGEQSDDFFTICENARADGIELYFIIDESHLGNGSPNVLRIVTGINPHFVLGVSATQKDTLEAQLVEYYDKKGLTVIRKTTSVPIDEPVKAQMVKREIAVNTGINAKLKNKYGDKNLDISEDELETNFLYAVLELRLALKRALEIREAIDGNELSGDINPLIMIQIENETQNSTRKNTLEKIEDIRNKVAKFDKSHGTETAIGTYLNDTKDVGREEVTRNDDPTDVLIFKQALTTGWNCPRAMIILKLKEFSKSKTFEIQTMGRVLRMPEQVHYTDEMLNKAYIFSEFLIPGIGEQTEEEFRKDIINQIFKSSGSADESIANLISIGEVELKDNIERVDIPKIIVDGNFAKPVIDAKKLNVRFIRNIEDTYEVDDTAKVYNKLIQEPNDEVKQQVVEFVGETGAVFGKSGTITTVKGATILTDTMYTNYVIRRINIFRDKGGLNTLSLKSILTTVVFDKIMRPAGQAMNLDVALRLMVANVELINALEKAVVELATELSQSAAAAPTQKVLFTAPPRTKTRMNNEVEHPEFENYAYKECYLLPTRTELAKKGQATTGHFRSTAEVNVEKTLDAHPNIIWWHKNGDRGQDHFGIPYLDRNTKVEDLKKERAFFPDYIALFRNDKGELKVGIIEAKRDEGMDYNVEQTKRKAFALAKYVNDSNAYLILEGRRVSAIFGGIVRVTSADKLEINPDPQWDDKARQDFNTYINQQMK